MVLSINLNVAKKTGQIPKALGKKPVKVEGNSIGSESQITKVLIIE